MINKFLEIVADYQIELQDMSNDELYLKELHSFSINGSHLNQLTGLINEKIKIADTFSHYIVEICEPKQIKILRRIVEEYEYRIEQFKISEFDIDEFEMLKKVTVSIDLLFGIDVSYYVTLSNIFSESIIYDVQKYFVDNIDYEITYDELTKILRGKGYVKK